MGRGSRTKAGRRRGSMAAIASADGDSRLAGFPAPRVLSCGAVSLVSPVSCDAAAGKGIQAASASASASEEGKILKHESEEEIMKLDSLKLDSEEKLPRVLNMESEEDRKILMKVKSEEGKILKLKKEYMEASEEALAGLSFYVDEIMPLVIPPAKKKKTKKVVVKTLVAPSYIALIMAMPCPTSLVVNLYSEEDLAYESQDFQDHYHQDMNINMKLRDYHQALVDQYEEFGYAVDEMEVDVTDDEDEDEDNTVKN